MAVKTFVLLGLLGAIMLGVFGPLQPETAVASTHGATRSFSESWVLPEGQLQLTVSATGYGAIGLLKETLPEGFTFVESDLAAATVKVDGKTVIFTLLGAQLITYIVTAPAAEGQYDFSGVLLDDLKQEAITSGDSSIRVGPEPTATPEPAPTNTPEPTATPKPTATPEPTATPAPTASPAPTATPELTPIPAPQPTATAVPTATPMPAPTAAVIVVTPTATAAPLVGDTEDEGGTPIYMWLPVVLLVLALLMAIAVYVRMRIMQR